MQYKIKVTKNYRLFGRGDNRKLDMKRHRALMASMKAYGFLPGYPIVCYRDPDKKLIVKDGQHRLAIAETLGLPIYWTEHETDFDVAVVNRGQKPWALRDYAERFTERGNESYAIGLEFAEIHSLPIGVAFALLNGTASFSNVRETYYSGNFVPSNGVERQWADTVASTYSALTRMAPKLRNARLINALAACARVEKFDAGRLLSGAERCRDKLVPYATRDAYLEMLEGIYNYGRKSLMPLKVQAINQMRKRNPSTKN